MINKILHRVQGGVASLICFTKSPIYHYHIRKTAGTSINFAFLREACNENVEAFYENLSRTPLMRKIKGNYVFVGWNSSLINKSVYTYAWSHIPAHKLKFKKKIFTFTCFRDPVNRVISHYNMLQYFLANNINHACLDVEREWLGNSFMDFISNLPKEHLMNQLYMFSESYDISEAINFLKKNKVFILFNENLENDFKSLNNTLNKNLYLSYEKRYGHKEIINEKELSFAKESLKVEYKFIDKIKSLIKNNYIE